MIIMGSVIDPLEFDDWVVDNDISINTPAEIKEAEKQFRKYIRDNRKFVMEDFSGKIVEKLPVYYTQRLEDMDRLVHDLLLQISLLIWLNSIRNNKIQCLWNLPTRV